MAGHGSNQHVSAVGRRSLADSIGRLPRVNLAALPTPLEEVPHFAAAVGDVRILVKRDDLTGRAFGGNKTRELEFLIGDAVKEGAQVFVAGGGVCQSNHAVQCSAAALRAGLTPVVVLQRYRDAIAGNFLLDRLMGIDVRLVDTVAVDEAIYDRRTLLDVMANVADEYRRRGHVVYILPSSFHPLAAVAYASCALELTAQLDAAGIAPDHVYLASAGATQAGLALALKHLEVPTVVMGISHTAQRADLLARLAHLANDAAALLHIGTRVEPGDLHNESFAGPGYGILTEAGCEAIGLLARTEGMFLDPVYSGKAMAGLLAHVRSGRVSPGATVVFIHTGGLPALFAYGSEIVDELGGRHEGTGSAGF